MCNHQHTKNYFKKMSETCHLADYLATREGLSVMSFPDLPVDSKGKCVFHSHDLKWKRAQRCGERFLELFRVMNADDALTEMDFREFWLTGTDFSQQTEIRLENAFMDGNLVLLGGATTEKPIRFRGAKFYDPLLLTDLACVDIDFDEAVFKDVTTFQRCHFRDFTSFIGGCRFEHNLVFEDCVFEQLVSFDEAVWMQQLFISHSDFKGGWVCPGAHQLANDVICSFSDVRFGAYSSFMDTGFQSPLTFDRCVFEGEIRFDNASLSGRFQLNKPEILEKLYFVCTKSGAKLFETAADFFIEADSFGTYGQLIFQHANLYNTNPEFKEQLRALELNHKIDIREGCLLYRTAIERIFPYSRLSQALIEDLSHAFSRFFKQHHTRNLQVDVMRDLKNETIRVVFHTDEAMSIEALEEILELGKLDLLLFLSEAPTTTPTTDDDLLKQDLWLQLNGIWQRFLMGDRAALLQTFFDAEKEAWKDRLQDRFKVTLNVSLKNIMIGNQIQAGGNVQVGDVIHAGLPVEQARDLAAREFVHNLQHLEIRLRLVAQALNLNADDSFIQKFDEKVNKTAPATAENAANNLRNLIARTDAAGLRHALNGHPLRQEFGRALVEILLRTDLQEAYEALAYCLSDAEEVQWAEELVFQNLEDSAQATTQQDIEYVRQRAALCFATLFNRAKIYHVRALRLLNALQPKDDVLEGLLQLHLLQPRKTLNQQECNELLSGLITEMAHLMQQRAQLLDIRTQERDQRLQEGFDAIEQQVTIFPTDTWEEVIIKARILRDFGRTEDAVNAFALCPSMFAGTNPEAVEYSRVAIAFTIQMEQFPLKGGLYLSKIDLNGFAHAAGLRMGDIAISFQHEEVVGMDDLYKRLLKTAPNTPLCIEILRYEPHNDLFSKHSFTLPSKPIGATWVPI